MKCAVIETGGKQYRITPGQTIKIEKLPALPAVSLREGGAAHEKGEKVVFDKVLLYDDGNEVKVGTPYVSGVTVEGTFEETGRSKKVTIIKFKRKTRYRRKYGHRQPYAKVKIK